VKNYKRPETLLDKRKEIGFETESVSDNEWREVKTDYSKVIQYYSKLSKKNLTGIVYLK
jgi:hypothetical protein